MVSFYLNTAIKYNYTQVQNNVHENTFFFDISFFI